MKTAILVFFSVLTGTSVFANTPVHSLPQNTREIITIRWLSKTLIRLGEPETAKRLTEDYYTHKRVCFGEMHSADGNAETGVGLNGKNKITLSNSMLNSADLDKLLQERPYGSNSNLIGDALTVVHEYVHMDQTVPLNYPRWENPAWQKTDKTLNKWVQKIEAEYNAVRKMPESKEKTAKLTELMDIVSKLRSEAVSVRSSISANVKNKSLTAGQRWLIDDTDKRLKGLVEAQKKYTDFGKLNGAEPVKKKDRGYWEMTGKQFFDKLAPSDNNYSLTVGDGSVTAKWWLGNDRFEFTANYTVPPKRIYPSDKIPVTLSVSVTNVGDYYSANGNIALFFDRPEIEPGFVSAPISLRGDKNITANISMSHKPGINPSPASSVNVLIDGSQLPAGGPGAKIALIVAAYNGRNAGCRYIYEWRDN